MPSRSEHKVALVTGAGRGIGRAIAVALAHDGFSLCLAARTREELEETRTLSGLAPERALIVLIDLAADEAPQTLFDTTNEHFGRLDVLINNAGWAPPRTPVWKVSKADQDRMLKVNLRAPIALTRLAAGAMRERKAGTIINVASAAARTMGAGEAIYAATKAGLAAFTHACFADLRASGVKISVIVPGLVDTALIPNHKRLDRSLMLKPADVAAAVMQIINSPPNLCPLKVVLEPLADPMGGA